MARVTVEDCLQEVDNRFALVLLAAKRTRQLVNGARPYIEGTKNKEAVLALREIAAGHVGYDENITNILRGIRPEEDDPAQSSGFETMP
ncbi:MAG: DNA-directed RNA polymerase subunit omega [Myxococcota bacterium]|nr:DNA-directed RNA polymerase subunit omega [Myxococcota bacterium]